MILDVLILLDTLEKNRKVQTYCAATTPVTTPTFSPKGSCGVLRSVCSFIAAGGGGGASETGTRFAGAACPFSACLRERSVVTDCEDLKRGVFKGYKV